MKAILIETVAYFQSGKNWLPFHASALGELRELMSFAGELLEHFQCVCLVGSEFQPQNESYLFH